MSSSNAPFDNSEGLGLLHHGDKIRFLFDRKMSQRLVTMPRPLIIRVRATKLSHHASPIDLSSVSPEIKQHRFDLFSHPNQTGGSKEKPRLNLSIFEWLIGDYPSAGSPKRRRIDV
jgi:hypothetical protein